jgi:hypothetical protein
LLKEGTVPAAFGCRQHWFFDFQGSSDRNPFNFIECNLIARAVVELRRARTFMRGHGLRIF